jgi:hypothetical protein
MNFPTFKTPTEAFQSIMNIEKRTRHDVETGTTRDVVDGCSVYTSQFVKYDSHNNVSVQEFDGDRWIKIQSRDETLENNFLTQTPIKVFLGGKFTSYETKRKLVKDPRVPYKMVWTELKSKVNHKVQYAGEFLVVDVIELDDNQIAYVAERT